MVVRTERRKRVGLLNGDGEIEKAKQLQVLSSADKTSIYIIIAQSNYEVKLGRLVIAVALAACL